MSLVCAGEGMRPRGACFVQGMGSRWLDGVSFVQGMGWACFVQGYLCMQGKAAPAPFCVHGQGSACAGASLVLCYGIVCRGAERAASCARIPHAGRGENSDFLLYYCTTIHSNTKTKPLHLESRGLSAPPLSVRSLHPTIHPTENLNACWFVRAWHTPIPLAPCCPLSTLTPGGPPNHPLAPAIAHRQPPPPVCSACCCPAS